MILFRLNGSTHGFEAHEVRLPNFEISWAGECPWNHGFCFGSEDGRIQFVKSDLQSGPIFPVSASGEAVNGVAFIDDLMAVSTRSDVTFLKVPRPGEGKKVESAAFDGGAHGVIATSFGRFVAPMGPGGLLRMEPRFGNLQSVRAIKPAGKIFNFYKSVNLGGTDQGDVLACAVRRDGLATTVLSPADGHGSISSITFPGLDVIDVCSLGSPDFPFAAAALGIDCSLLLSRDVLIDRNPASLRFDDMDGVAYRVVSAQGHIFVLTSQQIHIFPDLASRFLLGQPIDVPTKGFGIPIQAVDIDLAFDGCICIIMSDFAILIGVEFLTALDKAAAPLSTLENGTNQIYSPIPMPLLWEIGSAYELTIA